MEPGAEERFRNLWLGYTESQGSPWLRDEIASLYQQVNSDNLLVFAGAEEAVFVFMNAMLERGDHVIVHYPCYQSLFEVANAIGCEVTRWLTREEEAWDLDLNLLKSHLKPNTKAVVVNCPHNPTGYLMSPDKLSELVELSQRHGFVIFSDEVYRLLEYSEGDTLPPVCDLDERGVSLGVMSKAFGLAGLRIAWTATRNQKLLTIMAAFKDYTTICNSAPSEFLAGLALRRRSTLLSRNLNIIRDNLELLNPFFSRWQDRFRWLPPVAGPIAFPSLLNGISVESFCEELRNQKGVLLLPGTVYDRHSHNFRIGFGRRDFPEALGLLEEFLEAV